MTAKYYYCYKKENDEKYEVAKWDRDSFFDEVNRYGEEVRVVDWKKLKNLSSNFEFANDISLSRIVITFSFKKKSQYNGAFLIF